MVTSNCHFFPLRFTRTYVTGFKGPSFLPKPHILSMEFPKFKQNKIYDSYNWRAQGSKFKKTEISTRDEVSVCSSIASQRICRNCEINQEYSTYHYGVHGPLNGQYCNVKEWITQSPLHKRVVLQQPCLCLFWHWYMTPQQCQLPSVICFTLDYLLTQN